MDKYKRLASNVFIFMLSAMSSKLLVFIMTPFYTGILSQTDYGVTDIIVQTCNLLIPIATVGINNAVIRFGLERGTSKKGIFTLGLVTILAGFVVMCLLDPLIRQVSFIAPYTQLIYLFVLMSALHGLVSQFARSIGYIRLYAIDGIFSTLVTVVCNILFLAVFHWGIAGYVWSTILTDMIATVSLFLLTRLWRFVDFRGLKRKLAAKMFSYCVPLIPNTICQWIINISNRYLIVYMISEAANGIYAVANKIPTILLIVANIFGEAWQISAVKEDENRAHFFSRICGMYQALAFVVASGLILTAQLTTRILANEAYYEAWQYIPFLVMATTFACLSVFLSSVYMVERKSMHTLYTTMLSAILNVGISVALIPAFGCFGAAFATLVSYFVMFVVRAVHTRKYIKIRWNLPRLLFNIIAIALESVIMMSQCPLYLLYASVITAFVVIVNMRDLLAIVMQWLRRQHQAVPSSAAGSAASRMHADKRQLPQRAQRPDRGSGAELPGAADAAGSGRRAQKSRSDKKEDVQRGGMAQTGRAAPASDAQTKGSDNGYGAAQRGSGDAVDTAGSQDAMTADPDYGQQEMRRRSAGRRSARSIDAQRLAGVWTKTGSEWEPEQLLPEVSADKTRLRAPKRQSADDALADWGFGAELFGAAGPGRRARKSRSDKKEDVQRGGMAQTNKEQETVRRRRRREK